ncbi:hypothetical protein [Streptomyces iconiensis]|uniref:Uncharacterized protein n=1 Tax=Streptomyces iconiensis TaxID=1384038 RepID=A0ABT7A0B0_9ACTN|nr:hypothetical protein [Streptomyces iconiensis]MDJ1134767.1 hypothetical protein [Streptomyces iconiensis]
MSSLFRRISAQPSGSTDGQGGPGAEPDAIANACWELHTERNEPESVYNAMPGDWQTGRVADKFVVDQDQSGRSHA